MIKSQRLWLYSWRETDCMYERLHVWHIEQRLFSGGKHGFVQILRGESFSQYGWFIFFPFTNFLFAFKTLTYIRCESFNTMMLFYAAMNLMQWFAFTFCKHVADIFLLLKAFCSFLTCILMKNNTSLSRYDLLGGYGICVLLIFWRPSAVTHIFEAYFVTVYTASSFV